METMHRKAACSPEEVPKSSAVILSDRKKERRQIAKFSPFMKAASLFRAQKIKLSFGQLLQFCPK